MPSKLIKLKLSSPRRLCINGPQQIKGFCKPQDPVNRWFLIKMLETRFKVVVLMNRRFLLVSYCSCFTCKGMYLHNFLTTINVGFLWAVPYTATSTFIE